MENIGLRIKVDLDDKKARETLKALKKEEHIITVKFDNQALTNIAAEIERIKDLEIKSVVNNEALRGLDEMSKQLREQLKMLSYIAIETHEISSTNQTVKDNPYQDSLRTIKEINRVLEDSYKAPESQQHIFRERLDYLFEELDKQQSLVQNEKARKKLLEEQTRLQEKYLFNTKLYDQKQWDNEAKQQEKKSESNYEKQQVETYNQLLKLQKEFYKTTTSYDKANEADKAIHREKLELISSQIIAQSELLKDKKLIKKLSEEELRLQQEYNVNGKLLENANQIKAKQERQNELYSKQEENLKKLITYQKEYVKYQVASENAGTKAKSEKDFYTRNLARETLTLNKEKIIFLEQQMAKIQQQNNELDAQLKKEGLINEEREKALVSIVDSANIDILKEESKIRDSIMKQEEKFSENQKKSRRASSQYIKEQQGQLNLLIKKLETGNKAGYYDEDKLRELKYSIANVKADNLVEAKEKIRALRLEFNNLKADAEARRLNGVKSGIESLGTVFKNLTRYVTGAMIVRNFWSALREGIQTVKELNDAVTTLTITMEKFGEHEINYLIKQSQRLSKELKANINDILTTVKTVANENETMESIMAKTTPSVVLSNLTGLGTDQTVEMIQGAMQQFKELEDQSAESAMKVADSMVAISKSLSMDFSKGVVGMSEGVEILGSLADQVEMNLDTVLSVMSATAEKTRLSYSEIANALKTTISRTMRVADPSGEVSEEDMLKTEKALNSVGIAIRNLETGKMRPFMEIITELSNKWDKMTGAQQSYVAVIATAIVQ